MGVPAFFRWLSDKYPKIISPVIEDDPVVIDGIEYPPTYTEPNKNGELDNLYLDMNAIVHPCTHPEGRPPPANEDEMMLEVFKYTDRVVSMARPRNVLMLAVDGVAPRAKMNQQRSRRFRSARDAKVADIVAEEKLEQARQRGEIIDEAIKGKKSWDTNVITPGTPFMTLLAEALRYWLAYKLNTDPGWKDLHVILSDASVPGEGEHKVMEFVRSQRMDPQYNPNTKHCIYGLDADLIFLGLATHEPHFRVLREDVFAQNKLAKSTGKKPFIWLDLEVLRQYLAVELNIPRVGFPFDLERAIDDWVFMAFFCGNDFLPHLPSIDVRENGLDMLVKSWRQVLSKMQGYMTRDGDVNLYRVQILLRALASQEDDIFRRQRMQEERRAINEKRRQEENKRKRTERYESQGVPVAKTRGETAPVRPLDNIPLYTTSGESVGATHLSNSELVAERNNIALTNMKNHSVADTLRNDLKRKRNDSESAESNGPVKPVDAGANTGDSSEPEDNIRLWEPGYHERYYKNKFHVSSHDQQFVGQVILKYIEGVCWTLKYYYQGPPSWTWFYPYHYAPFASDLTNLDGLTIKFDSGKPFLPFEQLMSVLPAASSHTLPHVFRALMSDADSPIIDFYPEDFPIDMNGKKRAWQGIALLPFIDESRLLVAVREKYSLLTQGEKERNTAQEPVLMVSPENCQTPEFLKLYKTESSDAKLKFSCWKSQGLAGTVFPLEEWVPHKPLLCPFASPAYPDIANANGAALRYMIPSPAYHKSMLLQGTKERDLVLSPEEREAIVIRRNRSDRGNDRFDRRETRSHGNYVGPRPLRPEGYFGFLDDEQKRRTSENYQASNMHPGYSNYGGYGSRDRRGGHQGYQHSGHQGYQHNGHQGYQRSGHIGTQQQRPWNASPGHYHHGNDRSQPRGPGSGYQGYQGYQRHSDRSNSGHARY